MSAFPILNNKPVASETDPVCGMSVNPSQAAGTSTFKGKTYYFCAPSCKQKFDADPGRSLQRTSEHESCSDGTVQTATKDPVCGMTVEPASAAGVSDYKGTHYLFCSNGCKQKFDADPERYSNGGQQPAHTTSAQNVEFTCPMHPEVRQLGPGTCPKCGMALEPSGVSLSDENPELDDMSRRFWISAALTAPLLAIMVSQMFSGMNSMENSGWLSLLQFGLATPVVLWGGWPFFERGWQSVATSNRHEWNLNMFTLIALGTGVAYIASVAALLRAGLLHLYFEPAAVIVTLVLLGQVLELRARSKTGHALRALLQLAPNTARRVEQDGHERDISLDEVHVGDLLRIRPGEKIPVDGVVVDGRSAVDESALSGEPVPVEKQKDAKVSAGTTNGTGTLLMKAERVGSETLLSRIVQMVGEAQRTRAPIQRLADKVAAWFVPAVIAVAAITFLIWFLAGPEPKLQNALVNAVAVLIIACPCALGLATPMSMVAGTGRGAGEGVLIRDAESLELLGAVDTLVIDKTGTLTEGKPRLAEIRVFAAADENALLTATASLEQGSEHPLAAAVVSAARERRSTLHRVDNFESLPGRGVRGIVDGQTVAAGTFALMNIAGVDTSAIHSDKMPAMPSIAVAINGRLAGILFFSDPIKQSTPEAIRLLRAEGIRICMVTGDNQQTAEAVAKELAIEEVRAQVLPDGKAEIVRELLDQGRNVAMAGDGVNDAPALATATVGIAMGTGTDVAMESAGITLVSGDLRGVARAIRLSRATVRNIKQNLFFAFIYNLAGVPIAAGILYPFFGVVLSPIFASAAMTFSSFSVITNALRLRKIKL